MADASSAYIGLLGVVVGAVLTIAKDFVMHRSSEKKKAVYLAIRVSAMLEQFGAVCVDVAGDEGDYNERGHYDTTVKLPEFSPADVDVEWKSLPPLLLYRILDLPRQVAYVRGFLANIEEYGWDPPDNPEYFEERRMRFAKLGIEAYDLASALRHRSGLPKLTIEDWDPVSALRERDKKAKEERSTRLARIADLSAKA